MSLKTSYAPYFKIGAAVPRSLFEQESAKQNLMEQYNSFTCENDMKPEMILDAEKNQADPQRYDLEPAVCFEFVDPYLEFAKENGLGVRGHTLVWHSQTPDWFFREKYQSDETAPLANRKTMLARMESYIRSVLTYVQTKYPGVIYAWDVVNEAVLEDGLRKSLWYQTVGDDFIIKAFEFAAEYAEPEVRLFYNDYDTYLPEKREKIRDLVLKPLQERNLIHGMGMQSHIKLQIPELSEYEKTLCFFGETGLEVQVTELDIHNPDHTPEAMHELARRYQSLFEILIKVKTEHKANLTAVTLWGMRDEESWLDLYGSERSYPLLFHGNYEPKEAYEAVVSVPEHADER